MLFNTTIAVIGGAGKSGRFVVRQLIDKNISFRLLLGDASFYNLPSGHLVQGDVRDPVAVRRVCQGCSAIISTLGQRKGERPVFSHATRNVLAAMQALRIKRYILTTGINVDTPFDNKGPFTRAATDWMKTNYPDTTTDKQLEFEILSASSVNWTLVRLPVIGLTEDSNDIGVSLEDCPGSGIHGLDLARFLIRQIDDSQYLRQAPFLANLPYGQEL